MNWGRNTKEVTLVNVSSNTVKMLFQFSVWLCGFGKNGGMGQDKCS